MIIRGDARERHEHVPPLLPGATMLLDRHHNSPSLFEKALPTGAPSQKAALARSTTLRHPQATVSRPHNTAYPVEVMAIEPGMKPHDYRSAAFAT